MDIIIPRSPVSAPPDDPPSDSSSSSDDLAPEGPALLVLSLPELALKIRPFLSPPARAILRLITSRLYRLDPDFCIPKWLGYSALVFYDVSYEFRRMYRYMETFKLRGPDDLELVWDTGLLPCVRVNFKYDESLLIEKTYMVSVVWENTYLKTQISVVFSPGDNDANGEVQYSMVGLNPSHRKKVDKSRGDVLLQFVLGQLFICRDKDEQRKLFKIVALILGDGA